jgi:hypothetical protein
MTKPLRRSRVQQSKQLGLTFPQVMIGSVATESPHAMKPRNISDRSKLERIDIVRTPPSFGFAHSLAPRALIRRSRSRRDEAAQDSAHARTAHVAKAFILTYRGTRERTSRAFRPTSTLTSSFRSGGSCRHHPT